MIAVRVKGSYILNRLNKLKSVFFTKEKDINYNSVRFLISKDVIDLQAMNTGMCVTDKLYEFESDIEDGATFSCLVDYVTLTAFFKNHKNEVDMYFNDDFELLFKYGRGSFSTVYFTDYSYPTVFEYYDKGDIVIESSLFVPKIKRMFSFMEDNEFRPELSYAFLDCFDHNVNVVATDLNSLFINEEYSDIEINMNAMMFRRAAQVLYDYFMDCNDNVKINSDGQKTYISIGDVVIYSVNINRPFPNYKRVISMMDFTSFFSVDRKELYSCIESTRLVEGSTLVNMLFQIKGHIHVLDEDKMSRSKVHELVEYQKASGDDFNVTISKSRILTAIRNVDSTILNIAFDHKTKTMKFYGDNEKEYIICSTLAN